RAARAVIEGEGQALTRGPARPRARATPRTERPVLEMPLPKPHPAMQAPGDAPPDAPADEAAQPGEADAALPPEGDAPATDTP
ncbi:MAG: 2-oxoglutarate dehydrogenase, E2 component, dihydrolipoamide succinyltransferase, partial [Acidobacteria bacterium]|nr:2-oxoglutarate dehydrogenase, E2 component, dihydrolipoamide succinyltransferase [Acidobacteriota bacterium]